MPRTKKIESEKVLTKKVEEEKGVSVIPLFKPNGKTFGVITKVDYVEEPMKDKDGKNIGTKISKITYDITLQDTHEEIQVTYTPSKTRDFAWSSIENLMKQIERTKKMTFDDEGKYTMNCLVKDAKNFTVELDVQYEHYTFTPSYYIAR